MVEIETNISGDLTEALDKFERKIHGRIIFSGAAAMAKVMYDEVKLNTSGQRVQKREKDFVGPSLPGPPGVVTGTLHAAVYRAYSPESSTQERRVYHVSVNKKSARHWWLVEYGSSKSRPHPYLRPALARMQAAANAGMARMKQRMAEEGAGP